MAKITLYQNYPFDNSYKDTRLFNNLNEQRSFFANLTPQIVVENVTFSYGTLLRTRFNYDFSNASIDSSLMNYNYLSVENEENTNDRILYYFIVDTFHYDSGNVEFTLELDVLQTYLIDLQFDKCLIKRAHLDRYIDNGDGTVSFKSDKNSPFFKAEPLQYKAQYLVNRYELWQYDNSIVDPTFSNSQQDILQTFHNNNVNGYVYIFVDKNHNFNFGISGSDYPVTQNYSQEKAVDNDFGVYIVPINRTGKTIIISLFNKNTIFDFEKFFDVLTKNNSGGSFIYDIIISPVAPLWLTYQTINNPPSGGGSLIITPSSNAQEYFIGVPQTEGDNIGAMINSPEYLEGNTYNRNNGIFSNFNLSKIKINKSDIYNNSPMEINPAYEPKIYNAQYSNATLCNLGNETYNYDFLALQSNFEDVNFLGTQYNLLNFLVTASIQPAQCVVYARVKGNENSLYNENTEYNLNGIVSNQLMTLPVVTTAFQQQTADKKNFVLQALLNTVGGAGKEAIGAKFSPFENQQTGGLLGSAVDLGLGLANTAITIDNLKNAPSSLKNSSNAFQFNLSYTTYNPYLEIWQLTPKEQKELVDYISLFGYSYNEIDYPNNYFNTRMYYNFIQFIPTNFSLGTSQLSNAIKEKIEQVFTNGVRIWHTNTINFDNENPEKSINWSVT